MDDARAAYWSHAQTMGAYEYAAHWGTPQGFSGD